MTRLLMMVLALHLGLAGTAWAQSYPARPITYLHPLSPGSGDAPLRVIFDKFRERTGQPIIIDFRPGANTIVATEALLRAPADGYTIGFMATSSLPAALAFNKLPFGLDDFAPITLYSVLDQALMINPNIPAKTIPEFIAWAKSRPGKQLNFATQQSAASKLMMSIMTEKTGLPWVDIPFKGTPETTLAVVSGQADFLFLTLDASGLALANSGKLRILAIGSEKRNKDYPNIPTINETVPGFLLTSWAGFTARAKTPKPVIDLLFREFTFASKQPDVLEKMRTFGRPFNVSDSPEEFAQMIRRETEVYLAAGKAAGIVPQPLQ